MGMSNHEFNASEKKEGERGTPALFPSRRRENEGMSAPSPFMEAALTLARESISAGGGPFGAVVVRDGRIVGRGANRVVPSGDPTAHAEIVAIRAAAAALATHDLSGCEIYTSCEPCPMCLGAILWARIARVHHACDRADAAEAGFDDRAFHEEVARASDARELSFVTDGRERGLDVFRAWLRYPGRRSY
jgi:guanine deaminase